MNQFVITVAIADMAILFGAWLLGRHIHQTGKPQWPLYLLYALLAVVGAVAARHQGITYPDQHLGLAIMKLCASLPAVVLGLQGFLREKNHFDLIILLAIAFGLMGDVSINLSLYAGMFFYAIGHGLYDVAFITEKRPVRRQLVVLGVCSVLLAALLVVFYDKVGSPVAFVCQLLYLILLASTVIFAVHLPKIIVIGAMVFALSDAMLILNIIVPMGLVYNTISLAVYYLAMVIYGIAIWEVAHPARAMRKR